MNNLRVVMSLHPAKCCICGNLPNEYIQGPYSWFTCDNCNVSSMPCLTSKQAVDVWNSYNLMQDIEEGLTAACESELDILNQN